MIIQQALIRNPQ